MKQFNEPKVFLGFVDEPILNNNHEDDGEEDGEINDDTYPYSTKIGGSPIWCAQPPSQYKDLKCSVCGSWMAFLLQAYCPLDVLPDFERNFYIFVCTKSQCSSQPQGVSDCQSSEEEIISGIILPNDKSNQFQACYMHIEEELYKNNQNQQNDDIFRKYKMVEKEFGDDAVEWSNESYEYVKDRIFNKFLKRIQAAPNQCLRYSYGGQPLIMTNDAKQKTSTPPKCQRCQSTKIFEFQILSTIITQIQQQNNNNNNLGTSNDNNNTFTTTTTTSTNSNTTSSNPTIPQLEFGNAFIYSCPKNCFDKDTDIYNNVIYSNENTHCHIQEDTDEFQSSTQLPFDKLLLMGTSVEDWDRVNNLTNLYQQQHKDSNNNNNNNSNKFIRCFGIHPWFAYKYNPPAELLGKPLSFTTVASNNNNKWVKFLRDNLERYPESIVGEIGIDKVSKVRATGKCELEGQWNVFNKQMELAAEYNRLVSLHCVQLHGKLLEYFMTIPLDRFPRKIALHTYGGKPATVVQFLKIKDKGSRFYFGFSFINLSSSKIDKVIKAIPDDRILLESDQNTPLKAIDCVFDVVYTISKAKNWTIEQTIERTRQNALDFLA
eukprot:gene3943-4925_t